MTPPSSFVATLTGSFSHPAADNPTVVMMEAAYANHGVAARYLNCDVTAADLGVAVAGAAAMGWAGFNCSLPHKVTVIEHLDQLAESARLVGAVNCVVRRDGRWVGENTDGRGFVEALRPEVDLDGARVVVLGAGGAARAVAVESALAGAREVVVASRSPGPGQDLVATLTSHTTTQTRWVPWDGVLRCGDQLGADVDVLVNATSVGLGDDQARPALDVGSLPTSCVVADVIPNPPRTWLLRTAEAHGCRVVDGLGMLVEQGALALRLWTGLEADRSVMRSALAAVL